MSGRAAIVAEALGGRRCGAGWVARCPAHDDREPSLSIRDADDGKVLVRCHAGCSQEQVVAALRDRGLWDGRRPRRIAEPGPSSPANRLAHLADNMRQRAALAIWQSAIPADATLVETYLASRGLRVPPSPTLRFHAGLKHTSGLRTLDLPSVVREVIVLADGDEPGEAAAQSCAWRWKRQGRRVRVARPPQGMDFNDLLVGRTPREERV